MTPFVLAMVGTILALVMFVASRTFRCIMLSAVGVLVVCLVAFPRARQYAGHTTASVVDKFRVTFYPGAEAEGNLEDSALVGEDDEDLDDKDEEFADDDSAEDSDAPEKNSLIAEAYGAGAGGELVSLLAAQGVDPMQKLASVLQLASKAGVSLEEVAGAYKGASEPSEN